MDTETLVADPGFNLVQQGDILRSVRNVAGYMGNDMEILHMRYLLIKRSKLVEVRCEKAESMDLRGNMPGGRQH